jgi:metal iron transporter
MNRPSRTDEPYEGEGYNQSPNPLSGDLTTNQDLNGIANTRELRNDDPRSISSSSQALQDNIGLGSNPHDGAGGVKTLTNDPAPIGRLDAKGYDAQVIAATILSNTSGSLPSDNGGSRQDSSRMGRIKRHLLTYGQFVGPGFMIAVAYSQLSRTELLT